MSRMLPFRLVDAMSSSSALVIDSAICFEAPLREGVLVPPRFAAKAAPAAFCCLFDFAFTGLVN